MKKFITSKFNLPIAIVLGLIAGYAAYAPVLTLATVISTLFINLLKMISLPIIFLSLVNTAFKFDNIHQLKHLGGRVLKYTLLTTLIAAAIALILFLIINPAQYSVPELLGSSADTVVSDKNGYLNYLMQLIPSNVIQPFIEGNVISVFIMAIIFILGLFSISEEARAPLKAVFTGLYQTVLNITVGCLKLLPIAVWAFITIFVHELEDNNKIQSLGYYLACIILANLIQALIVLPAFLKAKGISPLKLFKSMSPALSTAFFSKSSSAALPIALQSAKTQTTISEKVANFSLPLCTTINMNACAGFILITVLFVSMSYGMSFSVFELITWIFIATIAAVGNASVPMGCYFLATSLLIALGVPVQMMAIILPVYAIIDMLESAINVWSDICVTAIVDQEVHQDDPIQVTQDAASI